MVPFLPLLTVDGEPTSDVKVCLQVLGSATDFLRSLSKVFSGCEESDRLPK